MLVARVERQFARLREEVGEVRNLRRVEIGHISGVDRKKAGLSEEPFWSEIRTGLSEALIEALEQEKRTRAEHRVHREVAELISIIRWECEPGEGN